MSRPTWTTVTLALATGLVAAMVGMRWFVSGEWRFFFLLWNLFLAWLPLLFAGLLPCRRGWPWRIGWGFLWLLFLPNAPYLVTDLIHLRPSAAAPLWYDALLLFTAAFTGLLLGLTSLARLQAAVARRVGARAGWAFATAALVLSSVGVYIGRFLRWNSWDLLTRPLPLLADLAQALPTPRTAVLTSLLSALLLLAYAVLLSLPASDNPKSPIRNQV